MYISDLERNHLCGMKNGYYIGIKKGKFAEYDYIENVKFNPDNGLSSLKKLMWNSIEEYAKTRYSVNKKE